MINIVTINVVNSSTDENRVNLSNFLNNECVNICVTWNGLYNFLLGGRDTDIIDLNYKGMKFVFTVYCFFICIRNVTKNRINNSVVVLV